MLDFPSNETIKIPKNIDFDRDLREKADFIYENAKEYLQGTLETKKNLERKAILMLSFIYAITTFVAFKMLEIYLKTSSLSIIDSHIKLSVFFIAFIITYAIISIFVVKFVFSPKSEYTCGNLPKNIFEDESPYFPLMKIGEALDYEVRIKHNLKQNEISARTIRICLNLIIILPIIEAVIILFVHSN